MRRAMLFALLAAGLAMPARAAILEEFTVRDWSGLALSDDSTGRLASCAVYSKYQNGATLIFIRLADAGWTIAVGHDDWALTQDSEYSLRYKVDRQAAVEATSVALNADQIGLALSQDDPLLGQVRRGKLLTITFQGKEYGFELSNSSQALKGAEDCIERHRNTVEQVAQQDAAAPDAAAPTAQPAEAGQTADESEASTIGEQQNFGPWVVTATDDGAGTFVNCTAFGVHGDDQLIISYRPDEVWEFGLYRAAWSLDTNQTYYLWYNVDAPADGAGVIKRPVEAVEPTRVFFEVSGEEDIVSRMENGRTLNVQLRGVNREPESFSYGLDEAAAAFAATRECTRTNVAAAQQAAADNPAPDSAETAGGADGEPAKVLPPIGQRSIESFEVPGWAGAAFADESGAFTHCAISAEYENGSTLALLRTAEGLLLLTLRRGDWTLQPGAWVPLRYQFKATEPTTISTEALAVDGSTLGVNLGTEEMIRMQLRTVPEIVVEAQEKSLSFDVSDIGPGLEAIDACAERHRTAASAPEAAPETPGSSSKKKGPATATPEPDPDPAAAGPPPPPAGSAEAKVEAAGYTTALLVRAGFPGHVILTGNDVPEALRSRDAAWKIESLIGMTDIVRDYTTARIKSEVISSDKADCGGPVTNEDIAQDATGDVVAFSSFCDGKDSDFYVFYVVIPREGGGHYNVMLIDLGDGSAARPVVQKLFDTAAAG